MHPPKLADFVAHDEDPVDHKMPIDQPSSFKERMDLDKFLFTAGEITDRTAVLASDPGPSKPRPRVRRNQRAGERSSDRIQHDITLRTSTRTTRSRSKASASSPAISTTTTLSTATQLQPRSTPSPRRGTNVIPSLKSRSQRKRAPNQIEEESSLLRDSIAKDLILLMVGVNPGIMTGKTGFAYAHPTNQFWKLLHASGITDELHEPSFTYNLPERYSVGNTNIVERPTRDASMLSKQEMYDGVPILEQKIGHYRPLAVCLVGKGIWEAVVKAKTGSPLDKKTFEYGWQTGFTLGGTDDSYPGAEVFVATTTSGVATNFSFKEKVEIWLELGDFARKMREERKQLLSSPSSSG